MIDDCEDVIFFTGGVWGSFPPEPRRGPLDPVCVLWLGSRMKSRRLLLMVSKVEKVATGAAGSLAGVASCVGGKGSAEAELVAEGLCPFRKPRGWPRLAAPPSTRLLGNAAAWNRRTGPKWRTQWDRKAS